MKIEIELTPGTAKSIGRVAVTLAILGIGAAVYANQTHFSSGQALTAAALNSNFDELYAATAKPAITRNGKSISVGGAYCGSSATPVDAATIGGDTGAKATCETTCSSATAHMCDVSEAIRSQQIGLFPEEQARINVLTIENTLQLNCYAWTMSTGGSWVWGVVFQARPEMSAAACSAEYPIACCD